MAKRYRNFKRICMSAPVGALIEQKIVDLTLNDHYEKCCAKGQTSPRTCAHSLDIARMVAPALKVGLRRATLDLPDEPELVRRFSERLRGFVNEANELSVKKHKEALTRVCDEAFAWAVRGPLHRLAEAGLELEE